MSPGCFVKRSDGSTPGYEVAVYIYNMREVDVNREAI